MNLKTISLIHGGKQCLIAGIGGEYQRQCRFCFYGEQPYLGDNVSSGDVFLGMTHFDVVSDCDPVAKMGSISHSRNFDNGKRRCDYWELDWESWIKVL
ncbi:MAG: hypothetical protein PHS94_07510 [Erysipelotrichaceae bacterium]|nr:hypothetical protein [Erysipelotrichaceae bacterium]